MARAPYRRKPLSVAQIAALTRLKIVDGAYDRARDERNLMMVRCVRLGLSYAQIAEAIGIHPSVVGTRMALYFRRGGDWTDQRRKRGRVV